MKFVNHKLNIPLSEFIENIFHYEGFMPEYPVERVVPTGNVYLIFELDGMTRHLVDNESLEPYADFKKTWISGMHRNFISISSHTNSEMLVIQFKSGGAYPFLHVPLEKLNDKVILAEQIFGKEILDLRDWLIKSNTPEEKFSLIDEWLLGRYNSDYDPPIQLTEILNTLQHEPATKYQEIILNYPNSQKHLIHQFKKYVGLTPKYYQRILRFNEILQRIQKKERISWTQIAYSCNYSDQSHFIKEFKYFSGFNPSEFIEMDYNMDNTNFFPLQH